MRRDGPRLPAMLCLALAATLAACDDFSLAGLLVTPAEAESALTLSADRASVPREGTVLLTASGGTPPYAFLSPTSLELYPGTSNQPTGHIANSTYTAGKAIGTFRLSVEDSAGTTAFVAVDVLPPAPVLTGTRDSNPQTTVSLSFTYDDSAILSSVRLELSTNGGAFATVDGYGSMTPADSGSMGPFNGIPKADALVYRLYAVSGSYESAPAEFTSPGQ